MPAPTAANPNVHHESERRADAPTRDDRSPRKVLADAGYLAVGIGVLGYQQVRSFADSFAERIAACDGSELRGLGADVLDRVGKSADQATARAGDLRTDLLHRVQPVAKDVLARVEPMVDDWADRLATLPDDVTRIELPEPFDAVPAQLGQLLEPVVEPIVDRVEPLMERARALVTPAA